jgi:hypothetical protein
VKVFLQGSFFRSNQAQQKTTVGFFFDGNGGGQWQRQQRWLGMMISYWRPGGAMPIIILSTL